MSVFFRAWGSDFMSIKLNNENSEKPAASDQRRPYQKPTLIVGPVLTNVTATKAVSGTAPIAQCWVARAAFGENDIRWMIFREWLVVEAPGWFHNLYIRHGEAIGAWLQGRATMQGIVRGLMMPAVNRTLRK
jgi:hypothetical protein